MLSTLQPILLAQLNGERSAQSYILTGQAAAEQALALAAALLCEDNDPYGSACGSCPSCRNVLAGTHPDCRVISPQGKSHKVEDMRHLVGEAGMSPINGARRVFIIEEADQCGAEGSNTLLKLLEEPVASTVLILLSQQVDALLPTILSRCQLFVLGRGASEPELSPELVDAAQQLLLTLPRSAAWEMLAHSKTYEKDRAGQKNFFFALLSQLHQAAIGLLELPFESAQLLRSAAMVESALEMLDNNVNHRLLADVVYLRLWQNCSR